MPPQLRIEVAGQTDVGRKRKHNEDSFAIYSEHGLYLVADGMGGHASGEVASQLAVETMREFFQMTDEDPERTWPYKMDRSLSYIENRLVCGIKLANLRIFETSNRDLRYKGMGTTIVSCLVSGDKIYMAPSAVQKERLRPDDIFILDREGNVTESPANPGLAVSACKPLFLHAYNLRNAGAVAQPQPSGFSHCPSRSGLRKARGSEPRSRTWSTAWSASTRSPPRRH